MKAGAITELAFTDQKGLLRALEPVVPNHPLDVPLPDRVLMDDLRQEVADALHMRLGQPSVASYKAWRRARGYELKSIDDPGISPYVQQRWLHDFGPSRPRPAVAEEVFEALWHESLAPARCRLAHQRVDRPGRP